MDLKQKGFVKNDKNKVRQQIQGMHGLVATLTKQPVFLLSDPEAIGLSNALCDVLDYHEINLTDAGGPYGLYAALGLAVFGIYKPRLDYIKKGGGQKLEGVAEAATPFEAEISAAVKSTGGMDFGPPGPGASDLMN